MSRSGRQKGDAKFGKFAGKPTLIPAINAKTDPLLPGVSRVISLPELRNSPN
jgi:hypothetical protein